MKHRNTKQQCKCNIKSAKSLFGQFLPNSIRLVQLTKIKLVDRLKYIKFEIIFKQFPFTIIRNGNFNDDLNAPNFVQNLKSTSFAKFTQTRLGL